MCYRFPDLILANTVGEHTAQQVPCKFLISISKIIREARETGRIVVESKSKSPKSVCSWNEMGKMECDKTLFIKANLGFDFLEMEYLCPDYFQGMDVRLIV